MSIKNIITTLMLSVFCSVWVYSQTNNNRWAANDIKEAYDDNGERVAKQSPLNLPKELALCGGEEGEVEIAGKFKEIRWNTGAKTPYITVQDTGVYTVTVYDGQEWFKDSIHVVRVPELKFKPSQTKVLCEGKLIRLTGDMDGKAWQWNNNSNKWGISVSTPGEYLVTSSNECYSITDTFHVVKASAAPTQFSIQIATCLKNNIPITAFGPAENYKWNTGQTTQSITVNSGGDYLVTFKVCDSTYTQNFTVDVKARSVNPLYFPNVFTPNSDNINDNFKMVGATDQITDFSISIFNRWGVLLFKSTDPSFEWNGTYKGAVVPDGVYFYGGGYHHNCSGDQYIPIEGSISVQR